VFNVADIFVTAGRSPQKLIGYGSHRERSGVDDHVFQFDAGRGKQVYWRVSAHGPSRQPRLARRVSHAGPKALPNSVFEESLIHSRITFRLASHAVEYKDDHFH
jgi:hypothetical protein